MNGPVPPVKKKFREKPAILIFLLSLILVYLILASQYENWFTPMAIILSVPLALIGTVLILSRRGKIYLCNINPNFNHKK